MIISFQNIIPTPLQSQITDSEIWGKVIDFSPNSHYALLATSGKGKSTLVHILYGLRKDYSGTLLWDGQSPNSLDWHEIQKMRRETFGIIFQDLRLFPKLTPKENIDLYHEGASIDNSKIAEMADRLGIADLLNKQTALLSYGQMQRVAILRTLSRPFKWLVMDEPFSHLDEENVNQAMGLINDVVTAQDANMILMGLDEVVDGFGEAKIYQL